MYFAAQAAGILTAGFGLAMNKQRPIFFVQLAVGVGSILIGAGLAPTFGLHGIAWSLLIAHTLSTAALTLMNCQWIGQNAVRFLKDVIGHGIPTLVFAVATMIAVIPIALSIAGWLL